MSALQRYVYHSPYPRGWEGVVGAVRSATQELERHQVLFAEPGAGAAPRMVTGTLTARAPEKVSQETCAQSALAVYGK